MILLETCGFAINTISDSCNVVFTSVDFEVITKCVDDKDTATSNDIISNNNDHIVIITNDN